MVQLTPFIFTLALTVSKGLFFLRFIKGVDSLLPYALAHLPTQMLDKTPFYSLYWPSFYLSELFIDLRPTKLEMLLKNVFYIDCFHSAVCNVLMAD